MGKLWMFFLSTNLMLLGACNQKDKDRSVEKEKLSACALAEQLYETKGTQGSGRSQDYLDSVIRLCPNYGKAWREISVPYLKRGDYASWMEYLNKAVELSPQEYLGIRGWCKIKFLHDYKGGLEDLIQYDNLFPGVTKVVDDHNIYSWMGLGAIGLKQDQKALTYFDKSIQIALRESGKEWVGLYDYLYRAMAKFALGDYKGALSDLDLQIKYNEKLVEPYYYSGMIYLRSGQLKQALWMLKQAKARGEGDGYYMHDAYVEMPWQIYPSTIEEALEEILQ